MTTFPTRSPRQGIPAVSLRALLPEAEIVGGPDLVASGISADSLRIEPGQVFVAIDDPSGLATARAIERGAAGVVADRICLEGGPVQVIVGDTRSALAKIAHAVAGEPSRWMPVVGVTGGEASEAALLFLRSIFEADGRCVGVAGQKAGRADAVSLSRDLATILERGCDLALAHVAPDGLNDRIADGLILSSALIASDGHSTRDDVRAFARLARRIGPGGILAVDCTDVEAMLLPAANLHVREMTFSVDADAMIQALVERRDLDATRLRLIGLDREQTVELPPIGAAALRAAMGAAAVARGMGATDGAIVAGLESVAFDPGRRGPIAFVLWPRALAHSTTDSLSLARTTLDMPARRAG